MKEFKINIQDKEIIIFQDDDGYFIKPEIMMELEKQGTATKPAHEPICMARKPLAEKTVAENCLKWGTGGINIDESRIGTGEDKIKGGCKVSKNANAWNKNRNQKTQDDKKKEIYSQGRFPANLIHDNSEEVRECFPETGGNASRYFKSIIYQAKASKSERNKGCDEIEETQTTGGGGLTADFREDGSLETASAGGKYGSIKAKQSNNHPTVKPIALMEYLIKMVTPKGGVVLDPFAGSGTTLVAAKQNSFQYIGIEMTEEYIPIIEARLNDLRRIEK